MILSNKTSYIVIGRDPRESKISKVSAFDLSRGSVVIRLKKEAAELEKEDIVYCHWP